MLVNWTRDCIKGIPVEGTGSNVILAPGYNDVNDERWAAVRAHVKDQIDADIIKEEWTKVKAIEAKSYPMAFTTDFVRITDMEKCPAEVLVPATLKDITRARVVPGVVKNTYHLPTLKKWLKEETRDDVIKNINLQIEIVNDPSKANEE